MGFNAQISAAFQATNGPAESFWGGGPKWTPVTNDGILRTVDSIKAFMDALDSMKDDATCPEVSWTEDCGEGRVRNCSTSSDCEDTCSPCHDPSEESLGGF